MATSDEVLIFDEPVRDVRLWTRSKLERPTTALRFREPVRIPPLRLFAAGESDIGWRASRSPEGVHIDGLRLRFVDPAAARRALQAAGAEPIVDDIAWWRRWRATRSDPGEQRAAREAIAMVRRRIWLGYGLLGASGLAGGIARVTQSWIAIGVFAALGLGAIGVVRDGGRRAQRHLRRAQDAADGTSTGGRTA